MKAKAMILCSMLGILGAIPNVFAAGELRFANFELNETSTLPGGIGASYDDYLSAHRNDGWLSFSDPLASEVAQERVKAHALRNFRGFFLPTIGADRIGYLDTKGEEHIFEATDLVSGEIKSLEDLNLPKARNVVVVPLSKHVSESASSRLKLCIHYHDEPETAWGFSQKFLAYPGGRVDDDASVLSTMLNEAYEESGFQMGKKLIVLGYRHDLDPEKGRNELYFYVLVNPEDIKEIPMNTSLPELSQFFPFDYSFIPNQNKEAYAKDMAALEAKDPELAAKKKAIKKKYSVKALFPRQRGDFDSNGVFWKAVNLDASPGERFVDVEDDGRFGSFKNPEVLRDLKALQQVIFGTESSAASTAEQVQTVSTESRG